MTTIETDPVGAEAATFRPSADNHAEVADLLVALRLRQLATLAGISRRLWPESPGAVADVLARLPELAAPQRVLLANDPFFHASFTGLVAALRGHDHAAARRSLARLIPTLLRPAARLLTGPIALEIGPGGTLGLNASGLRLRLGADAAGQTVLIGAADGVLEWRLDRLRRGTIAPGRPGCRSTELVAGTRATAFDGEDERLPQMLVEIGSDPSGFATETVAPATPTVAMREQLAGCFDRLGRCWPEARAEIEAAVRLIVPMRSERTSAFSNTAWQGAIFLRDDFADPLFLIERLVHESSHVRLNAVMVFSPLHHHAWDDRVDSPFRAGPRPVTGLIHGAFVFTRAAEALLRVARDTPAEHRAAAQAGALLDKVENALATVRSAVRLTAHGERLTGEIAAAHAALLEQCGDARPTENPSDYLLEEI
ncbi:HEXXH motif-containing protein [Nocardia tenerifensis]|uniref:HEXXH motif-containing protein n=1 Tax=Nocardia tenerifensis TaxID=228006 RepID=A0A318JS14_9NOCA|nr:HEXXH motif-containing putative peptide modification protein [Nocardia tenerifensis]PXX58772.1 HEXXH motif-containing protein [Nocardia tenerifensis]